MRLMPAPAPVITGSIGRLTHDVEWRGEVLVAGTPLVVTDALGSPADYYRVQIEGADRGWFESRLVELLIPQSICPAAPTAPCAHGATGRLMHELVDGNTVFRKGQMFTVVGEVITSRTGVPKPYYRVEVPQSGSAQFPATSVELFFA